MLRILVQFISGLTPFILGLAIGLAVAYGFLISGIGLQRLATWAAITAGGLFALTIVGWFLYRAFVARAKRTAKAGLSLLISDLKISPEKLADADYRNKNVWPVLPHMVQAIAAWITYR